MAVRALLRADALAVALGTALATVGLLTLGLAAVVRRRPPGPPWLGLFALPAILNYAEAAIAYVVPIPLSLLISRVIAVEGRQWVMRIAYGMTLFAIGAIGSDVLLQRPNSARLPADDLTIVLIDRSAFGPAQ